MKKPSSKKQTPKKSGALRNVDEYIAGMPDASRSNFDKLRAAIWSVMPREATEVISYGIPAFKEKKVLVWFAAFAQHCSLFPTASVIERFRDELNGFTVSKGTVQFPNDKPLPIALVKKLANARVMDAKGEVVGKEGTRSHKSR